MADLFISWKDDINFNKKYGVHENEFGFTSEYNMVCRLFL